MISAIYSMTTHHQSHIRHDEPSPFSGCDVNEPSLIAGASSRLLRSTGQS